MGSISLIQGLLIALYGFIMGLDDRFEFALINRPLPAAAAVGIILGDPATGCIVGGLAELAFTGLTPMGGADIPNGTMTGVMSAFLAITMNLAATEAFSLSLPFGYLMQYVHILRKTFCTIFNPISDRIAETGNVNKMVRLHCGVLCLNGLIFAVSMFLCTYAAQDLILVVVEKIPEVIVHGLNVGGGLMPAIGFSMMLSMVYKTKYLPYLIVGFVAASFIDYATILPVAAIGTAIALVMYFNDASKEKKVGNTNDGI